MEDLRRKYRKQGHGTAEQHREQIEGESAQDHRLAPDKPDPRGQTLKERLIRSCAANRGVPQPGQTSAGPLPSARRPHRRQRERCRIRTPNPL